MKFEVRVLRRAEEDVNDIFEWLDAHSTQGARTWLNAYYDLLRELGEHGDIHPFVETVMHPGINVRQVTFKTRLGNRYQAFYFTDGAIVNILRVRGPGVEGPET